MPNLFKQMFNEFRESALRIETLDEYHITGGEWEDFERYKSGFSYTAHSIGDWIENLKRWNSQGKIIRRIRIIPELLNAYLKYEFEAYLDNISAGEIIRVVPRSKYESLVLKEIMGDFWLFDQTYLLKMNYDNARRFLGGKLVEDNFLIESYKKLFIELERISVSHDYILKQIRQSSIKIEFK